MLEDATPLLSDAPALRAQAQRDGYVLLRGLLSADRVLALRRQFVSLLAELGWLEPGTDPMDAIAGRPATWEGKDDYWPAFDRFQQFELFHALPHEPALLEAVAKVIGQPVFAHPRNIGRIMFPDTPVTPPHQDYLHIRGTVETWTSWIAMGDIGRDLGGLTVLPGRHTGGLLPTKIMAGAGGSGIGDDQLVGRWLTTDYQAGDVLLLHSMTPHASLPNRTGKRMRLSLDYRYQAVADPVAPGSLKPHMGRFDWDHVYANWTSDRFKWYWRSLPLNVVEAPPSASKAY